MSAPLIAMAASYVFSGTVNTVMVGALSATTTASFATSVAAAAMTQVVSGAIVGAATAAITGGDVGQGAMFGALGGAVSAGVGAASQNGWFTSVTEGSDTLGLDTGIGTAGADAATAATDAATDAATSGLPTDGAIPTPAPDVAPGMGLDGYTDTAASAPSSTGTPGGNVSAPPVSDPSLWDKFTGSLFTGEAMGGMLKGAAEGGLAYLARPDEPEESKPQLSNASIPDPIADIMVDQGFDDPREPGTYTNTDQPRDDSYEPPEPYQGTSGLVQQGLLASAPVPQPGPPEYVMPDQSNQGTQPQYVMDDYGQMFLDQNGAPVMQNQMQQIPQIAAQPMPFQGQQFAPPDPRVAPRMQAVRMKPGGLLTA